MEAPKKALLLIGSPKTKKSTSEALGASLLERLRGRGVETVMISIAASLATDPGIEGVLQAVEQSDLVILVFPLYVDSLPYPVTRALELIEQRRKEKKARAVQRFAAICNCGFPEARHTETALAMCRIFARQAGMEWAGGLGLGGGQSIDGHKLKERGGMLKNVVKALDLAADALCAGKTVPEEAVDLMSRKLMPVWLYILMGRYWWVRRAKRNGVAARINDRPFMEAR